MMQLPHLTFLRSFEAAARHLSFTSAAEELNCTQSAVSNHVRSLEDFIGRPLFVRHARSLSLTDVGSAYLPSVRHALLEIDQATQSLILQHHKREVVISCPVSLGESWLPGVIERFSSVHPDISMTVHGTVWSDVEENVSDISITMTHSEDANSDMHCLWSEFLTLACAPNYAPTGSRLSDPGHLAGAQLIHILGRPAYWEAILKYVGQSQIDLKSGIRTNISNIGLDMAAQGLGCIALPRSLVMPYVSRGLLVEPFVVDVPSPWRYYVKKPQKSASPAVKLFYDWLIQDAARQTG